MTKKECTTKLDSIYDIKGLKTCLKNAVLKSGSIQAMAKEIGIADGTLRNFLYGKSKCPHFIVLMKIENWLKEKSV